jgi:hypothetical protein
MTYKERRIAEFREKLGGGAYAANNNFYEAFLSETIEECRGFIPNKKTITDGFKLGWDRCIDDIEAKFGKEDK